ncbi:hypothetical protein FGB62_150g06 [Gracilaria domingensis]|nr:hypothetical protein FGB62_150g06 [Gracilaria domingensis]
MVVYTENTPAEQGEAPRRPVRAMSTRVRLTKRNHKDQSHRFGMLLSKAASEADQAIWIGTTAGSITPDRPVPVQASPDGIVLMV